QAREGPWRDAPRDQEPRRVQNVEREGVAVGHLHDPLMRYQSVDERRTHAKSDAATKNSMRHDGSYFKNGILFSKLTPVLVLSSHDPTNPRASPPASPLIRNSTGFSTAPQ